MDSFIDVTAQRNSCTLLACVSTYSIMDFPRLISAASSTWAYSSQALRKESKIGGGVSVAVNMHSLIVSEIDQYLSIQCQVRSQLPTKSLEEFSVVRYVFGNFCYWYHVAQYYLLQSGRCSLLSEEEGLSGCCLVLKQDWLVLKTRLR